MKEDYKKRSETVKCVRCGIPIKINVINRKERKVNFCYVCWCKIKVSTNHPNGIDPRARKNNRANNKRKFEKQKENQIFPVNKKKKNRNVFKEFSN
jgi:hypothetical protein